MPHYNNIILYHGLETDSHLFMTRFTGPVAFIHFTQDRKRHCRILYFVIIVHIIYTRPLAHTRIIYIIIIWAYPI